MMDWNEWFRLSEPALRSGVEVVVPRELPHPVTVGFKEPPIAEPWGQDADWVYSLPDGARVHIHEFRGVMLAHIDSTDPSRGPLTAMRHWATESASGRATVFMSALWLLLQVARRTP